MAQQYKICPICNTPAHRNATMCSTCGTTLRGQEAVSDNSRPKTIQDDYDPRFGETDLSEATLRWKGGTYVLGALLVVMIMACAGIMLALGSRLVIPGGSSTIGSITPVTTRADLVSNTPRPTPFLPTVTPAPPSATFTATPTETPTPGPCMQTVQEGDDLYALVSRCGYRDYADILTQVVDINDISDPARIQIGQVIEIPWPTPTNDPNAVVTETAEATSDASADSMVIAQIPGVNNAPISSPLTPSPTETLLPGVMWHTVQKGENIIVIAYQYGANVEILSQLNPEITFSQCDFGLDAGGESCTVPLFEGQRVRVPAPTPTPTLSPTPSGSETPTPTTTPTFNAPSALSPANLTSFRQDEFVTLRWVPTGTLAPGQAYRVEVTDETNGSYYSATTQELFFIIPEGWQGQDGQKHEYRWTVSVINTSDPNNPIYVSDARTFSWQGRGESNS